ncbi:MAG TPA: DMT family transporter [Terriglobales bacterium]|nr:DMT family transporter [Terriglobales bacterium]
MTRSTGLSSVTEAQATTLRRQNSVRGFLYIGTAALLWGLSASMGRAAFTGRMLPRSGIRDVTPLILTQCRTGFSFVAVAIAMTFRRGIKGLSVPRIDFVKLFLLGLGGVAASNYFYYLAIQRTNVATAIIVQYTAPVWVLLYMVARGSERLTAMKTASVLLSITGIALVIGLIGHSRIELDVLGVVAALIAAFSFSYYNIGGHALLARYDRWVVLLYTTLAASLFWIVVNPPNKILAAHYSASTWLFLAVFSLVSVLLPFTFYFAGLERLVPTKAVIASCLEPVFSVLIAALALNESVGPLQTLGIAMVLGAIVLAQRPGTDTHAIAGLVD